jgi:hypothetical protein
VTLPPFRVRLDVMLAALRADPRVEVLDVVVRPPATDGALADAEAAIGLPLPPDLRRFYAAHDGVFVQWGVRGRTYKDRSAPFDYPDYDQPPGCINLLPVGEAMSPTWEEHDHVNEVQPEHQALLFGAPLDPQPPVRAVCVDNFSKYQHGDLILGPAPVMVVSTDHGADLESSDFCSVATYLDLTLAVFGADRYDHGLGIGWTRDPQRVDAWTRPADLDTIVRALLTDPE